MKTIRNAFLVLFCAIICFPLTGISFAQTKPTAELQATLVAPWLVTVDGISRTRTLIITGITQKSEGIFSADAVFGFSDAKQTAIKADIEVNQMAQLRLILTTQTDTKIDATQTPNGTFVGTFTPKNGEAKKVTIERLDEDELQLKVASAKAAPPGAVIVKPAVAADAETGGPASMKPLRVLFIGNSYTSVNDMPSMLVAFAASPKSPRQVEVKALTADSATLRDHSGYRTTKSEIQEGKWDFVVLQEQSELPTTNPGPMKEAAREIDSKIKKANAKTILFLTWARRGSPETQQVLNRVYYELAGELGAQVAPVGPAWQIAIGINPKIPLHWTDGSHQTRTGAYLNACVMYLVLIDNQQPCPAVRIDRVSPQNALVARNAAFEAVAGRGR